MGEKEGGGEGKDITIFRFLLFKNYQNLFVSFPSMDPAGRSRG